VSQEESEQNEVDGMKKGADSTGEVMHKNHVYVGGSKNVCKSVPTNGQSAVHVRQLPAIY